MDVTRKHRSTFAAIACSPIVFTKIVPVSAAIRSGDIALPRQNGGDVGIRVSRTAIHGHVVADHGIFCAVKELSGQYRAAFHTVHGDPAAISLYVDNARGYGIHFICRLHDLFLVVAAVSAWIEENGYEPDGKMFDIYHVSPHETDNPDEFVTEVCFPVKRK